MDRTQYTYTKKNSGHPLRDQYVAGMERFSSAERRNAEQLCIHAAFAGCGILTGILLFLAAGETGDTDAAKALYFEQRAFSSYPTAELYLRYLAGWFCHYALRLAAAMLPAVTTHPRMTGRAVCFLHAVFAGFGICVLSGSFSAFAVYYAAAQSGVLSLLLLLSVKAVRYAEERQKLFRAKDKGTPDPARFFYGCAAPLFTGFLLSSGALLAGMTAVSAAACFFL